MTTDTTDIDREHHFLNLMNDEIAKSVQRMDPKACRELAGLLRMKTSPWQLPEYAVTAANIIQAAEDAAEDIERAKAWLRGSMEASRVARKIERIADTWKHRRKARRQLRELAWALRRSWFAEGQEPGVADALAVGVGLLMEDL